jgi:hypothetical protein
MAQMLLDMAVTALLGVQIGGIRGQPFHCYLWMGREIRLHDRRAMGRQAIPDEDERPGNMALEMAQGDDTLRAPQGMPKMPFVNLARPRSRRPRSTAPGAYSRAAGRGSDPSAPMWWRL